MKNIYLIVGESGSGKTTIQQKLHKKYGLAPVISYTTRQSRCDGENNHIFVSKDEFDKLPDKVALTNFCDNFYCATSEQINNCDTYVIDPDGIDFFKQHYTGSKIAKIIYIKSPIHTRVDRMEQRGDEFSLIMERVVNDVMAFLDFENRADLVISNGDLDKLDDIVDHIHDWIIEQEK